MGPRVEKEKEEWRTQKAARVNPVKERMKNGQGEKRERGKE